MDDFWARLEENKKAYVVAEAGVNHMGSLELGEQLIKEAKLAGADAIKFQLYKAGELTTRKAPRFWDFEGEVDQAGSQFDSYSFLDSFGQEELGELNDLCHRWEIDFLCTPFDFGGVDYLDTLNVTAYKIASGDLTYHAFLEHIAKKGRPILLSTGACTLDEIREGVGVIEAAGNDRVVVMHCTLTYPTPDEDANINAVSHLRREFPQYPIGLSDHTTSLMTPIIARSQGAILFERHYTVDKTLGLSPDHAFGVSPSELKTLVEDLRTCETLLGEREKTVVESELRARNFARRSVVLLQAVAKGTVLEQRHLGTKRPGTGIAPSLAGTVVGMRAKTDLAEDTVLDWDMLE